MEPLAGQFCVWVDGHGHLLLRAIPDCNVSPAFGPISVPEVQHPVPTEVAHPWRKLPPFASERSEARMILPILEHERCNSLKLFDIVCNNGHPIRKSCGCDQQIPRSDRLFPGGVEQLTPYHCCWSGEVDRCEWAEKAPPLLP